jgi:hypothetical protein
MAKMTKKTRVFMLGSAAVLVGGICAGLVAYVTGMSAGLLAQAGPSAAELRYVPADAVGVGYANVREIMDSDLRRRLEALRPEGGSLDHDDFERQTGIKLETDVDRAVVAMMPRQGDGEGDGFAIVTGRFNPTRLEAFAREHGGTVEEYRGVRIVEGGQERKAALAFIESGVLAIGGRAAVRRAIDTRESGQNVQANVDLMRLMGDVEMGSSAWAVGHFDDLASQAPLPEGVSSQIPPIQWLSVAGHVQDGLQGTLRAETRDEQAASDLRDTARGLLAFLRLQSASQPEFGGALEGLQIGGDGRTVAISFTLPAQAIDAFLSRDRQKAND